MDIRSVIGSIIGILAVSCLLLLAPKQTLLPKGIALPAKTIRPAIASSMVVLYQQIPTNSVENLGKISIEKSAAIDDAASRKLIIEKAKTLAAQIGANGMIINYFEPHPAEGMGQVFTFIGTAIYMKHSGENR